MLKFVKRLTVLALAVLIASPLLAAEEAKDKKKDKLAKSPVMKVLTLPKAITLTAEQETKFGEVKTEFEGKLKELAKKQDEILTADQKKAKHDAATAAKTAGKKGKDAKADVDAAVKLTDDQKKLQEEVGKEVKEIHGKVREKIASILTDEQKTHLKGDKKKKKDAAPAKTA